MEDLKKYLFTVTSDSTTKVVKVTYKDMLINPDDIDDYQYAVDTNTNIYTFSYDGGSFKYGSNTGSYKMLIENINHLISPFNFNLCNEQIT